MMEGWLFAAFLIWLGYHWGQRHKDGSAARRAAKMAVMQPPVAPATTPGQGSTQAG